MILEPLQHVLRQGICHHVEEATDHRQITICLNESKPYGWSASLPYGSKSYRVIFILLTCISPRPFEKMLYLGNVTWNNILSFFMFMVILHILDFFLVFVSLMVKFGYFNCFNFTILRICCCAKTRSRSRLVLTSWSIVFSFDTLDRLIILWGYDKIPFTDPGWVSPWECEIGRI